jgi:HAD superfamily hydrolase (TIGR01509 family)
MSPRVVCFDVGGVLARIAYKWADAVAVAGLNGRARVLDSASLHDFPLFDPYQAGHLAEDDYLVGLGSYLGGLDKEEALKVHCSILIEPTPGSTELVRDLRGKGRTVGVLSNTNAPHWEDMHSGRFPGIAEADVRVASYLVKADKPHEDAYFAFECACRCEPVDILLFDDNRINVEAAKSVGWHAECVDPFNDPVAQMRDSLVRRGLL